VLLPYDNANQFVRELPLHRGRLASWTAWTAPKTLRPADVAKQVGMSEAHLREVNRIPPRMLVKAGSTLLVPRGEHRMADVSSEIADNAMMTLAPDAPALRRTSLRAGKRDTVASVFAVDGFGFDRAYFETRRWVDEQRVPAPYRWEGSPDYFLRAVDQGIGRALWFICGAHAPDVAAAAGGVRGGVRRWHGGDDAGQSAAGSGGCAKGIRHQCF